MNILKKFILTIKNIFIKKKKNTLKEPMPIINKDNSSNFIESLKENTIQKSINKKVETLTCDGDGTRHTNKYKLLIHN
jgi:hypothetical protein